jgi:prepilin peptidase CpaA
MTLLPTVLLFAFPALVIIAALQDAVTYTIPNWISLALLAVFPAAALASGLPLSAMGAHFAVATGALVLGMGLFALGWMGGGDAKLMAAAALWLGWPSVAGMILYTAIAGGGLSIALVMIRSSRARALMLLGPSWLVRLSTPRAFPMAWRSRSGRWSPFRPHRSWSWP